MFEAIKKGESETLEFKSSLSDFEEILATISAFSNIKGGTIFVGVDDNGNIVGVPIGRRTLENYRMRPRKPGTLVWDEWSKFKNFP
ncbi:MAG: ATP-binding protein [Nitrososphaeria archaeon]|nr:ATP-binding protein [Nitrososphaeria archaeon]